MTTEQNPDQYEEFDMAKAFMAWRQARDQAFQESGVGGTFSTDSVTAQNDAQGNTREVLPRGPVTQALMDKAAGMLSSTADGWFKKKKKEVV